MKKINYFLVGVLLIISSVSLAKNLEKLWYIGVGTHATDYTSVDPISGFFYVKDYSFTPIPSKFSVAKTLNRSLAIDFHSSVGEIDNKRLNIKNKFFLLSGLGIRYKFVNQNILKKYSWFDPYLRIGGNYHYYNYTSLQINPGESFQAYDRNGKETYLLDKKFYGKKDHFVINGGIGANLWINHFFGLNLESQYNYNTSYKTRYGDFLNHSASLVFRFKNYDKDNDGVINEQDECPEIAGLVKFSGCPDIDNDSVQDLEDKCPNEVGPKENNGCPWSDTDEDNVPDNIDKCPNEAGPKENYGCPWSNNIDTLSMDDIDNCFKNNCEIKENLDCNNENCMEIKKEDNIEYNSILFDTNESIIKDQEIFKLDSIVKMMANLPKEIFLIEGHTDNTGSSIKNKILSKKRADSVVRELENRGISKKNLISVGHGSLFPVADNLTLEGKQQNRRVEIKHANSKDIEIYKQELRNEQKDITKKISKKNKNLKN